MDAFVFRPRTNDFDSLEMVDPARFEVMQQFNGNPLRGRWVPLAVKVLPPEGQRKRRATDFPSFAAMAPVLSERAWEILRPLIEPGVEALPLLCADTGPLYILNVINLVPDALDFASSEIDRLDDGLIVWIHKHVLRRRAIAGRHMFKLAEDPLGEVIVSGDFRRTVEQHGLAGLAFGEVTLIE